MCWANSVKFSLHTKKKSRFSVVQAQDAYNCSVKKLEKRAGRRIHKGENHTHDKCY